MNHINNHEYDKTINYLYKSLMHYFLHYLKNYLVSLWREIIGCLEPGSSFVTSSAIAAITPALSLDAFPFTAVSEVLYINYFSLAESLKININNYKINVFFIKSCWYLPPKHRPVLSVRMQPKTFSVLLLQINDLISKNKKTSFDNKINLKESN